VALLAGCAVKPTSTPAPKAEAPILSLAAYADLPGWQTDRLTEALPALRLECKKLALLPPDTSLGGTQLGATYGGRAGQWSAACAAALALSPNADPRVFFEHYFAPYRVLPAALVTGYFEPIFPGALHQGGIYQIPVLARPTDLVTGIEQDAQGRPKMGRLAGGTLVPYYTRAEIEGGALGTEARPIAWLSDRIDLFFAQIQGAARIQLAGGGTLRLTFDSRNGRPYTPIGRILTEQGAIAPNQVSMQSIRTWLQTHPADAKAMMDRNESYVFFRLAPDTDPALGPPGALGVALTAGRSAAVDRSLLPLAAPIFVDSTVPDGRPWRHLVLAQDLGSAIAGAGRVDIFLGAGPAAAEWAGHMHQPATLWLLLPRPT
jgi:membrane-bound lytic murein transglycosylase A